MREVEIVSGCRYRLWNSAGQRETISRYINLRKRLEASDNAGVTIIEDKHQQQLSKLQTMCRNYVQLSTLSGSN